VKHFSDVVYGPIVAVRTTNDFTRRPPTPECQKGWKGSWSGSRDPVHFVC